MSKLTLEKSQEQAVFIGQMNQLAMELDVEYLKEALKEMKENHSLRESAAVLNPSPFTHNEKQDLNQAKLEQLELMLKLAENVNQIKEKTISLGKAKHNADKMGNIFGF